MDISQNADCVFYRNPSKQYPKAVRGEGIYVFDSKGKRYIDGSGGAVVVSIGHGVSEICDAIAEQASRISFAHGSQFTNEPAEKLAVKLASAAPEGLDRVYFLSGGSEAVETAVKMARQYQVDRGIPSKYKVISRWTAYHGNTLGALALSGHKARRRYYKPLIQQTPHITPAYCYRCAFGLEPDTCSLECADELEKAIAGEGPETVSAFIAEPVVGATAGVVIPPNGYFERIRSICDTHDVLFIADEVMTGIGRTGRFFGIDHWNAAPDIIVSGKGLASGYAPLCCVIAHTKIHDTIKKGNGTFVHGHTYSQNPVSAAAGLAVLDYIENHDLISRCAENGRYLLESLKKLFSHHIVGDIRGLGLFAGIEFVSDRNSREPFSPDHRLNTVIGQKSLQKGLICYPGSGGADGGRGDHILLAPPFITTRDDIDAITDILDEAFAETIREKNV